MKTYQTQEIKNIALLGNDGSGKTTLTESLLYEAGVISRRGRITQHNTVSDYFPVEQEYGYSVFSTVYHVEWNGKKLNIIDCPGSDDFVGAAMTALNVTDTAILLLKGANGVEVGTQNHFRYTEKLGKPVIFLVNQLDNEKCDYDNIVEQLKSIYGPKVVPVQYPVQTGPDFHELIDVLLMKKLTYTGEGQPPLVEDIPASEFDKAKALHMELVEKAAEKARQEKEKAEAKAELPKEIVVTQEMRQEGYDRKTTTDDHGMHIYGIAKDQNGTKYYMVKNSWGTQKSEYKGIWYVSEAYMQYKTNCVLVHKDAIPAKLKKKMGL